MGVSVWGVSVMETPPYGNERAVRILLECILVWPKFPQKLHENEKFDNPLDPPMIYIHISVRH